MNSNWHWTALLSTYAFSVSTRHLSSYFRFENNQTISKSVQMKFVLKKSDIINVFSVSHSSWSPCNEHFESERRNKSKTRTTFVHSTQGDKLFNVLIYMAWSQFSVLNMLVLYFKPQAKWEILIFFRNLLTVRFVLVYFTCFSLSLLLHFLGRMSLFFSPV